MRSPGLVNRAYFLESLERAVARVSDCRPDQTIALLFLDLDRFKQINDVSWGTRRRPVAGEHCAPPTELRTPGRRARAIGGR